jgi:uncharacterized CHY-type Zn-finger protein
MFQFQCPRCANVLQADPVQAGQPSQCPICQTPFIIPAPVAPPAAMTAGPGSHFPQMPGSAGPAATPPPTWPQSGHQGGMQIGPPPGPQINPQIVPQFGPTGRRGGGSISGTPLPQPSAPVELREPDILHIPCPQCKQLLETPVEMLDQEVLCPYCQTQFQLRRRDSVESQRRRQQELELKEHKAGRAWLNYAIVAAILVVLFLLVLIFASGA